MRTLKQHRRVRAHPEAVFAQLRAWAHAPWWPSIPMRFQCVSGDGGEGSVYRQTAKVPFGPSWHTKTVRIDPSQGVIRRQYLDGMFAPGYEEVSLVPQEEGIEVVYDFCYTIKNPVMKVLWSMAFRRAHIKNIEKILNALQAYVETQDI